MGRLIEEIEVYKRLRHKVDNGTLDEIMLDMPTVEAISKANVYKAIQETMKYEHEGFINISLTRLDEILKKYGVCDDENKLNDNVRWQLLDKLSKESIMVLETAYVYAKNYVLYGADITKEWTTAAQQAYILEQVRLRAFTDAYDSFKKDYENRLKEDLAAMLTEIQLEIEEQSLTHSEDNILSEWGLGYNHSVERCGELIQQKIDLLQKQTTNNCDNCFNGTTKGGCAVKGLMNNKDCKYYMPKHTSNSDSKEIIQQKINSLKSESEDKKDKIMKIKFITDFAGNWKTGDIVEAKYLEDGEVLVDGVAKIDTGLLLEHCRIISESED